MTGDRHPLHDATDEAERAGASYEVPVALVRARVRRRRRWRAAARVGAAASAVLAVVLVVPAVLDRAGTGPAGTGDWPAEFDRCGTRVEPATGDADGPVDVSLAPADRVIGADRLALVTTRVQVEAGPVVSVRGADSEAALVRDGVVVAVPDAQAPVVVELPATPWRSREPVLTTWDTGAVMVSCAPYPGGTGDPRVPVGDYDLVVTQTVAWSTATGEEGTTVASGTFPVTVTDDAPSPDPDRAACLADASVLAATGGAADAGAAGPDGTAEPGPDTSRGSSPRLPVAVDADVPAEAATGDGLRLTVRVTTTGPGTTHLEVEEPDVVLTRDGEVRGNPLVWRSPTRPLTLEAGQPVELEAGSPLLDCTTTGLADAPAAEEGLPLPAGGYEVWVLLDLRSVTPDGEVVRDRVVAGPWPVRLL